MVIVTCQTIQIQGKTVQYLITLSKITDTIVCIPGTFLPFQYYSGIGIPNVVSLPNPNRISPADFCFNFFFADQFFANSFYLFLSPNSVAS